MITESSKLVQALPHLASTMLMPTSVTDKWGAPDASSLEEAHKGITYVATLTESKVVEVSANHTVILKGFNLVLLGNRGEVFDRGYSNSSYCHI